MVQYHILTSPAPDATGTITVWNGTTTQTAAATDLVRPSDWNSAHSQVITLSGNTAGNSTVGGTNVIFQGGNNITLSGNGDTIVISSPSGGGAGDGGNIIAAGTQTAGSTNSVVFSNSNGISFGMSNSSVITASYTVPSQTVQPGIQSISAGTTRMTTGEAVFSNSNGISFGVNGNTVTASHNGLTTQTVQTQNMVSVLGSTGNISFANSNGITFGGNASTITASHNGLTSQSNQAVSGSNGSFTFQTATFGNLNGMSFYTSNGSMVGSYTVPTVTNSSMTVSDAATSGTLARLAFTNLNGVTLSLSTGAGGSHTIVGSHNGLTSQSNQAASAANGSFAFQTISFSNLNGISFGTSAGSAITASHNALTSQSNQAASASNGSFAFQTLGFSNANNVTFGTSAGSIISASVAAQTVQTQNMVSILGSTGNISFANGNNITFGGNASTVTASASFAQSAQTVGGYAVGNTTGASSSSTVDARSFSIQGAGAASVGFTNGSWVVSAPNAAAGNVTFSAGTTSNGLASIVFSNSNGVSFGLNGSTITASAAGGGAFSAGISTQGNTAGTTGFVGSQIQFVGSNDLTLSQSANGGSATLTINGPTIGTMSKFIYPDEQFVTLAAHLQGTIFCRPVQLQYHVSFSRLGWPASIAASSLANTSTCTMGISNVMGIYTIGGSTLSRIVSGFGNNSQIWSSNQTASVGGMRLVTAPVATMLTPGYYYVLWAVSTSSSNAANGLTPYGGGTQGIGTAAYPIVFGQATNASKGLYFLGMLNTTAGTSLADTYHISQVNQQGATISRAPWVMAFENSNVFG